MPNDDKDLLNAIGDTLIDELKNATQNVSKQFEPYDSHTPYRKQKHLFTKHFYKNAEKYGLTEADAIDVYEHGKKIATDKISREYDKYEIEIEFSLDSITGLPVIDDISRENIS